MNTESILFFVSKNSIYFESSLKIFRELEEILEKRGGYIFKVIDVIENPEQAEEYKVNEIPTLIIANKRFIGALNLEKIITYLKVS